MLRNVFLVCVLCLVLSACVNKSIKVVGPGEFKAVFGPWASVDVRLEEGGSYESEPVKRGSGKE